MMLNIIRETDDVQIILYYYLCGIGIYPRGSRSSERFRRVVELISGQRKTTTNIFR